MKRYFVKPKNFGESNFACISEENDDIVYEEKIIINGDSEYENSGLAAKICKFLNKSEEVPVARIFANSSPVAVDETTLITTKQLAMLYGQAREINKDADAESYDMFGCSVEVLTKSAGSQLIDHFKALKQER